MYGLIQMLSDSLEIWYFLWLFQPLCFIFQQIASMLLCPCLAHGASRRSVGILAVHRTTRRTAVAPAHPGQSCLFFLLTAFFRTPLSLFPFPWLILPLVF